ncbi:Xaa-Pro aminopeptidase [Laribacter hongkongensis]|uniref:Xaa-Pro aminopeptidase n=1 Tax=Laribacter hongkongensis TaxID=168471 RepID=UPI001EFCD760|nr:Xaa-Pro aminopeptidase [Laribacter hongkongensis]MCG8992322.1 Xaa-Pro aminopeptidase [Laribacter hongkongensis]MCG8997456.1 Xaa-Pro aminopeptidase [Laribacter hongkongensis]MCG9000149.1 Xaa-Pro aminopeptidase [Laribacter hongkongensis]MCG9003603.1 Xaa-Pro aminopeptidase [Laribacter hongkongensis]MCG9008343.1 Xaa-Pro aminopeptidase [Laribacter hongkongensis]
MIDNRIYASRRQRLMGELGDGIAILPTAPELVRNGDAHYAYRFDSSFYYLTGFAEPEAVLVLDATAGKSVLFCRDKDIEREIWNGYRFGPEGAKETFGFDEAYSISEFDERLPDLLADRHTLHMGFGRDAAFDARVNVALNALRARFRTGVTAPTVLRDVQAVVHNMRLFKDDSEIALMREAGRISAEAHVAAMRAARPGRFEYQLEAEILRTFCTNGARTPSYESIVAGGGNACVLHYVSNQDVLKDGDLVLIDAGCEYQGYAGDITRTFPVNGRFSAAQRDVYDVVLAAELAAIAAVRPGARWNDPADAALRVLVQGLIDLGLLSGSLDGNIESEAYKQFYMHRIGHWLGLDVHDCGDYKVDGQWREYRPGMVTTVEPGLYLRPADNVPEAFWNIGIRIEDDVLCTAEGHEILTAGVPKSVADIEALMAEGR